MRKTIAIATIVAALALLHPVFNSTNAMFGQTFAQQTNQFAGATFSPTVAPVVSVTPHANGVSLMWSQVSISSAAPVTYEVMRSTTGATPVAVCVGVNAPTQLGVSMNCVDTTASVGVSYTYTEKPIVFSGLTPTWSLPVSVASAPICLKKCK